MRFLVNPAKKKRKRRSMAQRRATAKLVALNKRRRRTKATGRRRRATAAVTRRRAAPMAKRRRSATRRRVTARRRRSPVARKRYSRRRRRVTARRTVTVGGRVYRNPGIPQMLIRGVVDAAFAVTGETAARFIAGKIPPLVPGVAGTYVNTGLSAIVVGLIAGYVPGIGADRQRILVQGAMQAPVRAMVGPVLAQVGLSSYSQPRSLGLYSQPRGLIRPNGAVASRLAGDAETVDVGMTGMGFSM